VNNLEMKMNELRNLNNERGNLLNDLGRSAALQTRFPGCFDNGKCKVVLSSTHPHEYPENCTLKVAVGGEVVEVSGSDEPETIRKIYPNPTSTGGDTC